jgi:hypothetical protein
MCDSKLHEKNLEYNIYIYIYLIDFSCYCGKIVSYLQRLMRRSCVDAVDSHLKSELLFQWKTDLNMSCYHAVPLQIMPLLGLSENRKRPYRYTNITLHVADLI